LAVSEYTLLLVVAGALLTAFCGIAVAGIYHLRVVTARRLHALEDALRVYNNASAALGRRLLTLESQYSQERRVATQAVVTDIATVRTRRPPAEESFSEAELRLAQLIKARLPGLRLN
jgi:hypothetical protein